MIQDSYYDSDEMEDENLHAGDVQRSAKILYGLIHARFILTNRGIAMMMAKWRDGHFGQCPR